MIRAVILIKIDSVNKFAISITVINTERDFKSAYLFRMCSVVTNLVTPQEFKPICCATTLCHFGQTRNGYVGTHFILLNGTAESSATNGYVVFPERFGQNQERLIELKNLFLFPAVDLFDAICKHM